MHIPLDRTCHSIKFEVQWQDHTLAGLHAKLVRWKYVCTGVHVYAHGHVRMYYQSTKLKLAIVP